MSWSLASLLPGLYVAGLGFLLGKALERWYDPVPRRAWAVFALALALFFGLVLAGGMSLFPGETLRLEEPFSRLDLPPAPRGSVQWDAVHQFYPWQSLVRRALAQGQWPLWDPVSGAGQPFLSNPLSRPLEPFYVLAYPFPLQTAEAVTAALKVLVALVFLFLLLKRQGLSSVPSLAGSLAYGCGAFLIYWLHWPQSTSAALLPLLLYAAVLTADRGARRDYLLLAVALAAALLAGHPETTLYGLGLAGLFALARLPAVPRPRRRRHVAASVLAAGVALGATAPFWLPAALYLPQTLRHENVAERNELLRQRGPLHGWRTAPERAERMAAAGRTLLPATAPHAFGISRFGAFWGERNSNEVAGFAGTAALLGALLALPGPGIRRRFPQERLVGAAGLAAVVIVAQPPGYAFLLTYLPVLKQSASFHVRLLMVIVFALAYLSACSWERWRRGELGRRRVLAAAAAVGAVITGVHLLYPPPADLPGTVARLRVVSLGIQGGVLIAVAGLLASRLRPGRWRALALPGLVLVELAFFHLPLNPPAPKRLFYPTTPALTALQERLGTSRMVAMGKLFGAHIPTVYDLSDIRSSNPAGPAATGRMLRPLCAEGRIYPCWLIPADHPLYDFLGVRYVLALAGEELPPPFRRIFGEDVLWLYERPGALPPLFLPRSAAAIESFPPEALARHDDFLELAAVEPAVLPFRRWGADERTPSRLLGLEQPEPAHWRARAWLYEPRLLATSLYQDGGWHAIAGGERRPAVTTNGFFTGAWLGAGLYDLHLVYRPPGFLAGMILAALSLAAGCGWWWAPVESGATPAADPDVVAS